MKNNSEQNQLIEPSVISRKTLLEEQVRDHLYAKATMEGFAIHKDGYVLDVNDQFPDLLGYNKGELIGKSIVELIAPEFLPLIMENIKRKYDEFYEASLVKKDKSLLQVEIKGTTLLHDGKEIRVVIVRDLTERKKIEADLVASEKRFKDISHSMADWIWEVNSKGKYTFTSGNVESILGYLPDEMLGKTPFVQIAEEETDKAMMMFHGYISQRKPFKDLQYKNISKDGREVYLSSSAVPMFDELGNFSGYRGVNKDISSEVQSKEQLSMFKKFAETSKQGMGIGTLEGKLVYFNQANADLVGVDDPATEYGKDFLKFYAEDIRDVMVKEVIPSTVENGQWSGEFDMLSTKGTIIPTFQTWSIINDDAGNPLFLTAVITDITERKKTEEELSLYRENLEELVEERTSNLQEANNKLNISLRELERSNSELEQFAYVASHDLQEPLRKVKSYAELLHARYEAQLDDKANKYIGYMVNGAERMQTLISDLLTFSRVTTQGKSKKDLSLESAIKHAIDNLDFCIQDSHAKIQIEQLPLVKADETQMIQLFQNLVGNAIKFRNDDTPDIQIKSENRDNEWIISVHDNGIGIEAEYQDKIFEVFQRLHSKEEYPGTGIGLAVCKKIVERHGGRIWMESKNQAGSTFYFTLPVNESK